MLLIAETEYLKHKEPLDSLITISRTISVDNKTNWHYCLVNDLVGFDLLSISLSPLSFENDIRLKMLEE